MAETPGFPAVMAAFYIETRVGILQRAGRLDDTKVLQDLVKKLGVAVKNLEEGRSRDRAMALERYYYGALHELKGDLREALSGYFRAYEIGPQPRYRINGAASLYRLCCANQGIQALFVDKIEELHEFVATNLHLLDKGDREKVQHLFTA